MSDTITPIDEELKNTIPEVADEDQEQQDETAVLSMSDEEFEKQLSGESSISPVSAPAEGAVATESVGSETTPASSAVDPKQVKDAGSSETTEPFVESTGVDPLQVEDTVAIAGYKALMAPFKANGKTVQAQTPEEAMRLMQMGAGHIKYQNQVRPLLVRAKTLENNKISDDDLNFLVELHNKNPEAIKKLVRDAGIDPYDIQTDEAAKAGDKDYRPKNYSASETQITLETVLQDVQASEHGPELLRSVRADWDEKSRGVLLEDPEILQVLVNQKESGIYDRITNEIERRKSLGGLANASFLEAYHKVGQEMEATGAFRKQPTGEQPGHQPGVNPAPAPKKSEVIATRTATPKQSANGNAVRAIAPVRQVVTPRPDMSNVLNMSDEEFQKLEHRFG